MSVKKFYLAESLDSESLLEKSISIFLAITWK